MQIEKPFLLQQGRTPAIVPHTASRRLSLRLKICLPLLYLAATLSAAILPVHAQVWDLSTDFSIAANPNGAWAYGSKNALNANLVLYTNSTIIPSHYQTQQLVGWSHPLSEAIPYIAQNISEEDWEFDGRGSGGGIAILLPQEILLHPSSLTNTFSVVRWTAPASGLYTLDAGFRRFEQVETFNSSYAVLHNGVELPDGSGLLVGFSNSDSSAEYTNSSLFLTAGDTLEFVVGIGTDGTSNTDGTTVRATINLLYETVSISGRITLQGGINQAQPVTFEFRPTDGSETFTRTLTLNPDRTYTLTNIPKKTYSVWIKGARWLAKVVAIDATQGSVTGINATLRGGDANNDNSVDILDLDVLIQAFDSNPNSPNWNAMADLNADDGVDVQDLDLLILNFDRTGDA